VRTTISQERSVADLITTAVVGETDIWECKGEPKLISKNQLLGRVKAILVPETLRGYVFLETLEFRDVELAISGVPHVRGRVSGKVSFEEIDKWLKPKPAAEGIMIGDVVEIISGPFKGERARVARVDAAKEELILELLDSPHTIPIRVHADFAKIVEKAHREEPKEGDTTDESKEKDELDDDSFWAHQPDSSTRLGLKAQVNNPPDQTH
jgi:transcriptional antiterminator NusG